MTKVIVFVHGAGKQPSDYYKQPLAAISNLLGATPPSVGVWYADIANVGSPVSLAATGAPAPAGPTPRSAARKAKKTARGKKTRTTRRKQPFPSLAAPGDTPEVTRFKMAFAVQAQSDMQNQPTGARATAMFTLPGQNLIDLLATELNEISGYLFNSNVFNQIQKRMQDGLAQAAQLGDTLVIASHSLGTVISFDALKAVGGQYHVSEYFTLGSPLAKLRQLGQRGSDLGAIASDHVNEWLNYYDTTDPVSNPLGPSFPTPGYRLYDVFVDIAPLPPASHDYFNNGEVLAALANAMR